MHSLVRECISKGMTRKETILAMLDEPSMQARSFLEIINCYDRMKEVL